jgi:hypothetical protein
MLLISWGIAVGLNIVGSVLVGATGVGILGMVFQLAALAGYGFIVMGMANELKSFTNSSDLPTWMALVPLLQLYFFVAKLPAEVAKAKQMAGVQAPARSAVLYFFLPAFALPADLNDIAG